MRDRERGSAIGDYVASLAPTLISGPFLRRRVKSEVTEHLRDIAARYRSEGLSDGAAEARAIEEFGSEEIVADGFLVAMREVRVMIRNSKIACVLGAGLWFLTVLSIGLHEFELDGGSAPELRVPFPALVAGGLLLSVGVMAVHAHNKRAVPRLSFWAWLLMSIGFTLGGPFVWGLSALGTPALFIGSILMGVATIRAGLLPRVPGWLLIAAAPGGAVVHAVAVAIGGYGASLSSFAGPTTYVVSLLAAVVWLTFAVPIRAEEPMDSGPTPTPA